MFEKRLENLKGLVLKNKLNALLVSNASNIFYLTGFSSFSKIEREAYLLITPKSNFVLTDGRYTEAVTDHIKGFTLLESKPDQSAQKNLENTLKELKTPEIGFEENSLSYEEYRRLSGKIKLTPCGELIEKLRVTKDRDEIEKIKKACRITDLAFEFIQTKIQEGMSEKNLSHALENFIKSSGADISFEPIVAFGMNSSSPHHSSGETKLEKNQIVLLDFGANYEGYCSDFTRTLFFGKAPERFKKMYQTVKESQQKAFNYLNGQLSRLPKPGSGGQAIVNLSMVDKAARDFIIKQGYPSIPHSLGHQIGIDVHEEPRLSPKSKEKLKNGMVFSVEPGIYAPGFGGVRIEDLVLFDNGPKLLTSSNRDLIEL